MRKALVLHHNQELFDRYRRNGMKTDFSWERTCLRYVQLYEEALLLQ